MKRTKRDAHLSRTALEKAIAIVNFYRIKTVQFLEDGAGAGEQWENSKQKKKQTQMHAYKNYVRQRGKLTVKRRVDATC